ncbi:MAG: SipW-dependent-type signal peptide-containing protein [Clostridia bacterium]|nr:SipW-dependent-type signal peptide-containing protein [Clostridia bacterium]
MTKTKHRLIMELLLLVVALILFVQTSFAYFTSKKETGATITSGTVSIMLSEAAVTRDGNGNLVEDTDSARIFGTSDGAVHDYGVVFPGQGIFKDPTISNTGDGPAWIAAKVTITDGSKDVHRVLGFENYDDLDLAGFMTGGLMDEGEHFGTWNGLENVTYSDNFAMLQVPHRAEGRYDVYFFVLAPLARAESVVLFENLYFSGDYDNIQIQEFAELKIDVVAYGVQNQGFASCYEAMLTALPEHFEDFLQPAP